MPVSRGVPRRYPLQPPGHLQIELIPLIFFFPFFLFPRSMSIKIKAVLSPLVAGPGAASPQQGFSPNPGCTAQGTKRLLQPL